MVEMKTEQRLPEAQHMSECRRRARELHRGLDHGDNPCGIMEDGKIGDQEFGTNMHPQS